MALGRRLGVGSRQVGCLAEVSPGVSDRETPADNGRKTHDDNQDQDVEREVGGTLFQIHLVSPVSVGFMSIS